MPRNIANSYFLTQLLLDKIVRRHDVVNETLLVTNSGKTTEYNVQLKIPYSTYPVYIPLPRDLSAPDGPNDSSVPVTRIVIYNPNEAGIDIRTEDWIGSPTQTSIFSLSPHGSDPPDKRINYTTGAKVITLELFTDQGTPLWFITT